MTGFNRVLALCVICFVAKLSVSTVSQKKVSFKGARIITITYLLDGNEFKYVTASEISTVKTWLEEVQYQAELMLKDELSVTVEFQITNINLTDQKLSRKLHSATSIGSCGSGPLMHAGTVLEEIKEESGNWPFKPNIICVLTKVKLFQGDFTDLLGYTMNKTLCYRPVPMLLTYDRSKGRIIETGKLLFELVVNSTNYDGSVLWKQYFNVCHKKNKLQDMKKSQITSPSRPLRF
uniref:Putative ixodes 26 kDa salivary protein n=1 Tax=Ixodes ricinus TaxID=34613 RepID=A0A0K8RFN9_IXORI